MPLPSDYSELSSAALDVRRVEALWSFQASSTGQHLVLPDGRMDLIVRFRVDDHDRVIDPLLMIVGPSQLPANVDVDAGDRFFGLRFRAGRGGACLGIAPMSLRNSATIGVAVEHILGKHALRLLGAKTACDMRDAMIETSRQVGARAVPAENQVIAAIDLMHLSGGRLSLASLATATGVPERSLRRQIAATVGLPFKALASVLRFQRTLRLLAQAPSLTLGQAAYEGGYSDQAHMTREFQRHGGFTPGARPPVVLVAMAETFKIDNT